ncbi:MAG: bifunctional rhamnulose-1-phosphate aldolase/short-chain dehydrogenase [Planctomycetes bacterium]|nr:bifunctional rhamnulose-1-phosphate aldolase/short-chain dehydrogenase [Planctomycetota bacterium]
MPTTTPISFNCVENQWCDDHASSLDPLERLVYRSNLLGSDQLITNTGGGNTSSKLDESDPLSNETVQVLWVKGSGGDLRTATSVNFSSLYQNKLLALENVYCREDVRGVKTEVEDRMVSLYPHCTFNLNPRASSIDTPLHAFVSALHIDHTHPNSVIAIAAAKRSEELTREIYGEQIAWTPWQRPGFDLGLIIRDLFAENPDIQGVVLGQHGLINWANDDKECYELSLTLINKAAEFIEAHDRGEQTFGGQRYSTLPDQQREAILIEIMPWLRGQLSQSKRVIATVQLDANMLRFINSVDAPRLAELGTSCPDHFLRTKIKPLLVEWDPQKDDMQKLQHLLVKGLEQYRRDYQAYYDRCKHPDSPAMRDPNPTVILIPGIGMIAWGRNKSESRVTAEFYNCAIEVMRGAEAIDEYIALPQQEAFDIEYWSLEEAKLRRMPPEKELQRRVVLIIGAGSGIGKAVAHRLADEGAHVVCADLDQQTAAGTEKELTDSFGFGVGVAGSGISNCGPAVAMQVDISNRESVNALLNQVVLAYGGLDHVVITAGLFPTPEKGLGVSDQQWKRTFDVNVMGAYIVIDEARKIWEQQQITGSVVLTTSVNGIVPKKGSLAYDTSKAAANHLVRELAIELAPLVRVNGVAPATVIEGSTMFPRHRVVSSLAKYGIDFDENAETEILRNILAKFYASRTLIKEPITPTDQAQAIAFLLKDTASRTTGQILAVDGGLPDAFMR